MLGFFEGIGHFVISMLEYIGGSVRLFTNCLGFVMRGKLRIPLTVNQMSFLGVNSLLIVLMTTTFAGMVIALQLAHVAVQYGVGKMVGGSASLAMARELGPMLTAIVVAGRAGSAITAEIGSMKVTEQIDALKMLAVSPIGYLVVPRLLAMVMMMPLLTLFSDISGLVGGSIVEVGKGTARTVAIYNDPGPDFTIGAGIVSSKSSEGDRMVWDWLADSKVWRV